MPTPLLLLVVAAALASAVLLAGALVAVRHSRWIGTLSALGLALLCLALAALAGTVGIATLGYRALTHEEVAALVTAQPVAPDRIRATFRLPDGSVQSFELAGNGFSIEAHIVKWHPRANILGLHTAYSLSRVAGRYDLLEDERGKPRTIHALARSRPVDVFHLARGLTFLAPLVDAEYGSATFLSVREPVELELRVSTSGLLLRRARGRETR